MNRRELLKNLMLAPFQSILFFNAIAGEKTGSNEFQVGSAILRIYLFLILPSRLKMVLNRMNQWEMHGDFPWQGKLDMESASTNPQCTNTIIVSGAPGSEI